MQMQILPSGAAGDVVSEGVLETPGGERYGSERDFQLNMTSRSGNADVMPPEVCKTSMLDAIPAQEQHHLAATRVRNVAGEEEYCG